MEGRKGKHARLFGASCIAGHMVVHGWLIGSDKLSKTQNIETLRMWKHFLPHYFSLAHCPLQLSHLYPVEFARRAISESSWT